MKIYLADGITLNHCKYFGIAVIRHYLESYWRIISKGHDIKKWEYGDGTKQD